MQQTIWERIDRYCADLLTIDKPTIRQKYEMLILDTSRRKVSSLKIKKIRLPKKAQISIDSLVREIDEDFEKAGIGKFFRGKDGFYHYSIPNE